MNILIVEDEPPIARDIEFICREVLKDKLETVTLQGTLSSAKKIIMDHKFDLCLLDLNLNGENGFSLLEDITTESFHTVIVSAYTEKAIEAFEYGVFDFIAKPFDRPRFEKMFNRYFSQTGKNEATTKYLSYRKKNETHIINIDEIHYFRAADTYVLAELKNGNSALLNKTMDRLEQILPDRFLRIHRSYIVDINSINSFGHDAGGKYKLYLKDNTELPLNRKVYKELSSRFHK
ncbi:MAG: LytTR family DNA-binding domain-containing protein [Bacteroidetes bacterium]|nr:LytTR family DNA-binding domain-containing protein [Bacteroidota bacterium]